MLPADSVENIRKVLDQDAHAFPVWCVRAMRLLLDERECLVSGLIGEPASEAMAKDRRRICALRQVMKGWAESLDKPIEGSDEYVRGIKRGLRNCIYDVLTVLEGEGCG